MTARFGAARYGSVRSVRSSACTSSPRLAAPARVVAARGPCDQFRRLDPGDHACLLAGGRALQTWLDVAVDEILDARVQDHGVDAVEFCTNRQHDLRLLPVGRITDAIQGERRPARRSLDCLLAGEPEQYERRVSAADGLRQTSAMRDDVPIVTVDRESHPPPQVLALHLRVQERVAADSLAPGHGDRVVVGVVCQLLVQLLQGQPMGDAHARIIGPFGEQLAERREPGIGGATGDLIPAEHRASPGLIPHPVCHGLGLEPHGGLMIRRLAGLGREVIEQVPEGRGLLGEFGRVGL